MEIEIPQKVTEIITQVRDKGYEIYIVGGAVRDTLIKRPTYDWDFTTNAKPEEILEIFSDAYYNNDFGMVGIPATDEELRPYEITTYRTEQGYSDSRRPDSVDWGKTLKEDVERRDFTINALAFELIEIGKVHKQTQDAYCKVNLIDYFEGEKDLQDHLIRAVGNPNERFSEDALRMMRAVRIASELNFEIEEKTKEAITENVKLIHKIAAERIKDELLKLIASPHAYNGIRQMREVGLLQEILPELDNTFGVEQKSPGRHHIHDVGTHSLLSLKFCPSQDPIVRLATLIHDIGKATVRDVKPNGVVTFYNHEVVGGKMAKNIANRLRLSKKQSEKLYKLVRYHQFTVDENQTDAAIRRFIKRVGKELVPDMLDLRVGDRLGGGANETSWRLEEFKLRLIEVQKQPFSVHDLKISGSDVMKELNLSPSPRVGEILQDLFQKVVNNEIENKKETLVNELKTYA